MCVFDRVRGGSAGKTPRRRSCPRQRHHQRQSKVIRQTSANLLVDEADLVEDLREIVAASAYLTDGLLLALAIMHRSPAACRAASHGWCRTARRSSAPTRSDRAKRRSV